jgi:valyl-tRNA synthetase
MDLQDILKSIGMNVGDIRSRLSSKVIKMDGEEVTDVRKDLGEISEVRDFGKFIELIRKDIDFKKYQDLLMLVGFDDLMSGESNIKNELTDYLKDWHLVRTSSSSGFFMKKGKPDEKGILFDMDGQKKEFKKIEVSDNKQKIDIEKIKSDLAAVEKQLSNKGFVDKAPEFKVKQAKDKKERLEKLLADAEKANESFRFIKNFNQF